MNCMFSVHLFTFFNCFKKRWKITHPLQNEEGIKIKDKNHGIAAV